MFKNIFRKNHTYRIIFAMVIALSITFSFIMYVVSSELCKQAVYIENGVIDLTQIDFEKTIAELPLDWDYYPDKIYNPDDFNQGIIVSPRKFTFEDERLYNVGTYKTILKVLAGKTYALNGWALDYSSRIFVNGEEALHIGNVTADSATFVPGMKHYLISIIPDAETNLIEIIIQYANFSHHEGGAMRELIFGEFANVSSEANRSLNFAVMLGGALLLIGLFYFMLSISGRGMSSFAFSLCCFLLATRNQQFLLSILPADYNWNSFYRFVYLNNIYTGLAFLLLCYNIYIPVKIEKKLRAVVCSTIAATLALTVTAMIGPTTIIARMVAPSYIVFIPAIIAICYIFGKIIFKGKNYERITAFGIAVLFSTLFLEMILQRSIPEVTRIGLGPFGMLTFAICQMLSLGVENETLNRLNRMKTEFLQEMSHEMQNPLTVIATGIDYADDQVKTDGDTTETQEALKIVRDETQRLGRMIRGMVRLAEMNVISESRKRLNFTQLLQEVGKSFQYEFQKLNNIIEVDISSDLPDVFVEKDKFKQVLTNLLTNAAKHTKNGQITLKALTDGAFIEVSISDNGEGISPQMMPNIFKRGVSSRGSTGYGLYICKTIIEAHGGIIEIRSGQDIGTVVRFTVPIYGGQDVTYETNSN